jgi:cytochrome P450
LVVNGEPDSDVARTTRVAVRAAAREAYSRDRLAEWQRVFESSAAQMAERLPRNEAVDLIGTFAEPWALSMAMLASGAAVENQLRLSALARDVFLDAAHSTTGESSSDAALQLASALSGGGAIDVQSFVALSQTVPAFLGAAWLELFRARELVLDVTPIIDELLRFAGPSRAVFRRVRAEIQIGDANIEAGQRVALMLARANRDPEKFFEPDRLDFARDASAHLAFGHGAHACVGASIVRMAVVAATNALLRVARDVTVLDVQWLDGFAIRAPLSLVVVEKRPSSGDVAPA